MVYKYKLGYLYTVSILEYKFLFLFLVHKPNILHKLLKLQVTLTFYNFSNKKQNGSGVSISEDEFGNYIIDVSVTLKFGCELAKVASEIQQNIVRDIKRMTTNGVRKVNVFVERVESTDGSTESEGQECIE